MHVSQQSLLFLLAGIVVGLLFSQVGIWSSLGRQQPSSLEALRKDVGELKRAVMTQAHSSCNAASGTKLFPVKGVADPDVVMSKGSSLV